MRVICAYREPTSGAAALEVAKDLMPTGGELTIVHIVEPEALPWGSAGDELSEQIERDIEARRARIQETAASLGLNGIVVVDAWRPNVSTAERIAREAREREADFVIVVSRRASGVRGLMLGSVAQALLQLAPCPVVVVRSPEDDDRSARPRLPRSLRRSG